MSNNKPDLDSAAILRDHGIQPSAQRMAVAGYVLSTDDHPSADRVWKTVSESFPMISRATVYNTLHLFVEKGLLRELHLTPESTVFDSNTDLHHHFIDDDTGAIEDVAWDRIEVRNLPRRNYDIRGYQVVMHGTKKTRSRG